MSDFKWYVLQVYSGHENKVKANIEKMVSQHSLQEKIAQIKIPTMDVIEMKNGKKKVSKKKLMPGYVLIEMKMDEDQDSQSSFSCGVCREKVEAGSIDLGRDTKSLQ